MNHPLLRHTVRLSWHIFLEVKHFLGGFSRCHRNGMAVFDGFGFLQFFSQSASNAFLFKCMRQITFTTYLISCFISFLMFGRVILSKNIFFDFFHVFSLLFLLMKINTVQGETENFLKNFQDKRGDREIENIFGILERVSELRYL